MVERETSPGISPAGAHDAEVENAHPSGVAGEWEAPATATGPAGIPPNHIVVGTGSPLGEDPVVGSVVSEDWGRIPGAEPDVEQVAVRILDEDSMV
jgi:hypothetical protein